MWILLAERKLTYVQILAKNEDKESWKIITREILLEIYGNTLGNYSATGRRGERQAIHPQLHKGLFGMIFDSAFLRCITYLHYYRVFLNIHVTEWSNRETNGSLNRDTFNKYINKCAFNKRKYQTIKKAKVHSTPFVTSEVRLPMSIKQQSTVPKKNLHTSPDVIDLYKKSTNHLPTFRNIQQSVPPFQSGIHIVHCVLLSNKQLTKKLNK